VGPRGFPSLLVAHGTLRNASRSRAVSARSANKSAGVRRRRSSLVGSRVIGRRDPGVASPACQIRRYHFSLFVFLPGVTSDHHRQRSYMYYVNIYIFSAPCAFVLLGMNIPYSLFLNVSDLIQLIECRYCLVSTNNNRLFLSRYEYSIRALIVTPGPLTLDLPITYYTIKGSLSKARGQL